jgi:hypothetical protein
MAVEVNTGGASGRREQTVKLALRGFREGSPLASTLSVGDNHAFRIYLTVTNFKS